MTDVTDADRETVIRIIKQAAIDEKWLPPQPYRLHVYRLAAALAEERAKARAPFLTAADKLDERAAAMFDDKRLRDEITTDEDEIIADAFHHCADRIRRAAEESQ